MTLRRDDNIKNFERYDVKIVSSLLNRTTANIVDENFSALHSRNFFVTFKAIADKKISRSHEREFFCCMSELKTYQQDETSRYQIFSAQGGGNLFTRVTKTFVGFYNHVGA